MTFKEYDYKKVLNNEYRSFRSITVNENINQRTCMIPKGTVVQPYKISEHHTVWKPVVETIVDWYFTADYIEKRDYNFITVTLAEGGFKVDLKYVKLL
jgi:hypothetical protein